ncbi:MAG TPA: hypothetical protein V6C76_03180 [Drouetiella sp.]
MSQNFLSGKSLLLALSLLAVAQLPAWSHPKDYLINDLSAQCFLSGDSGSAKFVNVPSLHQTALQLVGKGTAVVRGTASFPNIHFTQADVYFTGACSASLLPASMITRISFTYPNSSNPTALHTRGYDCARNIAEVLPNGVTHVRITQDSICDCNEAIGTGAVLTSVDVELSCADAGGRTQYSEQIYRLDVNGQTVPFDLTTPSASCSR